MLQQSIKKCSIRILSPNSSDTAVVINEYLIKINQKDAKTNTARRINFETIRHLQRLCESKNMQIGRVYLALLVGGEKQRQITYYHIVSSTMN